MSGVIWRNETNDEFTVNVFFYLDSVLFDPSAISYSIFKPDGLVVTGQENKTPIRYDTGWYYVDWTVSGGSPIGIYKVKWTFQQYIDAPLCSKADTIAVVGDRPESCVVRHIPSGSGDRPGASEGGASEQCGTCQCQCQQFIRDQFGRIINI